MLLAIFFDIFVSIIRVFFVVVDKLSYSRILEIFVQISEKLSTLTFHLFVAAKPNSTDALLEFTKQMVIRERTVG